MGINDDELDKLAESAREEIARIRGSAPEEPEDLSFPEYPTTVTSNGFTWNAQQAIAGVGGAGGSLMNHIIKNNLVSKKVSPTIMQTYVPGGIDQITYNGTNYQSSKHDKGICQESYDKGYADGLKALSTPPPSTE